MSRPISTQWAFLIQFNANKQLIETNLRFAAQHGPVIVTGHSLGGALAQMAATEPKFQPLIARVVTFASPGINRERIKAIERYNQAHKSHEILSTHYRIKDKDLVPKGGEAWTPGQVHEFNMLDPQVSAGAIEFC
ncbi:lipase family protein [Anthocerotibacter panamensis]|uniref:lipase family protein n=1 Tax=Anthocerotibacter panamensis TaxID=2857077 RepID=UPI001C401985